ncbi:MAG: hypothetical protein KAI99_13350 [Cyclobacteriaceae bacterium]|nr:hypothetical protein [Cyclobacteriaceae bacterium]
MKRKKKKVNAQQTRQEQATRLNSYKKKILHYLKLMNCEEVAFMITNESMRAAYRSRYFNYPKIQIAEGVTVSNEVKKEIHSDFEEMFATKSIEVIPGLIMSPKEVVTYLIVIYTTVKAIENSSNAKTVQLIQNFYAKFPDMEALFKLVFKELAQIMSFIGLFLTRQGESICWMDHISEDSMEVSGIIIEINEFVPEKRTLIIDGNSRPIFRYCLAFANTGPRDISIPAEKLDMNGSIGNLPIAVFLQQHVLHRLEERLDCLPEFIRGFNLFTSLYEPDIIQYKGRILAGYYLEGRFRLGYIVLEYLEGILVAKTFLLLTNNGTPEGDRLKENSGLTKIDHQYWTTDKLSAFQNSDIKDHAEMKEIFEKAGCGILFEELPFANDDEDGNVLRAEVARHMFEFMKTGEDKN